MLLKHFVTKQGDQLSFTVTFKNLTTPLTSIEFGAMKSMSQEVYDVYLYENHGINKLADNKYQITISPEITADLEPAWYFYDLQIRIGSVVKTPLSGKLVIQESVL